LEQWKNIQIIAICSDHQSCNHIMPCFQTTQSVSTDPRQASFTCYLRYPHVGPEHSHDRLSASRTNHTSAPPEHHCAQVCNNTTHHPNKHDQLCTSTVTPLCASYPLSCTIVRPSHRQHCLRARSNPELLSFHQLHTRSHHSRHDGIASHILHGRGLLIHKLHGVLSELSTAQDQQP
jgi:hypothetical protein